MSPPSVGSVTLPQESHYQSIAAPRARSSARRASTSGTSRTLTAAGGWVPYAVALVPLTMALHLLGLVRIPVPRLGAIRPGGGAMASFVTGLLLSLVLAPCGTPVLASVLSFAAYKRSVVFGGLLLFVYGIGAGLPVLAVGTAISGLARRLDGGGWRRWVDGATGLVLLGLGFYLLWVA